MRMLSFAVIVSWLMIAPVVATAQPDDTPVPGAPDADHQAFTGVTHRIRAIWAPACDVKGFKDTHPDIRFVIGKDGNVSVGPDWTNPNANKVWQMAADRARAAVVHGQPYEGRPENLYGRPIVITFDAQRACN